MIENEGIVNVHRIYETAQQDGVNLHLGSIGRTVTAAQPHPRFRPLYKFEAPLRLRLSGWRRTRFNRAQGSLQANGQREPSKHHVTDLERF